MPTAAKLAAAVLFGALAWWASQLVRPAFPAGTDLGRFAAVNALVGVVAGWRIAGPRAPAGWVAALSYGLTTAVAMTLAALVVHSVARMIRQSLRRLYEGPVEAVAAVFGIMADNLQFLAPAAVWGTLLVGGALAGLATEWVGRTFR